MTSNKTNIRNAGLQGTGIVATVVAIQAVAAIFFIADAIRDLRSGTFDLHIALEAVIAFALLAGVAMGAWLLRRLLNEAQVREQILAIASGALAEQMRLRFHDWQLTEAEAEVALFAIKGCDAAEIARLRHSATGTVRAQLSRVYTKAGVASQAELVSLFIDDLVQIPPAGRN